MQVTILHGYHCKAGFILKRQAPSSELHCFLSDSSPPLRDKTLNAERLQVTNKIMCSAYGGTSQHFDIDLSIKTHDLNGNVHTRER